MRDNVTDPIYLNDLGIVCAIGAGKDAVWNAVVDGPVCGIRKTEIDGTPYVVGSVPPEYHPETAPPPYNNRLHAIELQALREIETTVATAVERYGPHRVAVLVGSTDNESEFSLGSLDYRLKNGRYPEGYRLEYQQADFPARFVADHFGLSGPVMAIATACSSSAGAIINAREMLRAGFCDAAIVGGADIVSRTVLFGFDALEILSHERCQPFSRNRNGINLGEGAAFFVMSRERLTAGSIGVLGVGESSDAYHMTAPDPTGAGAVIAMRRALDDAGLQPEDIDYLNLHGTGTKMNDAMESAAVANVFFTPPPAGSTKSLTGHTLGAAGALELGICWLALGERNLEKRIPPHVWDGNRDETLPKLDLVDRPRYAERLSVCSSNSFAFGGSNVNIVIGDLFI